MSLTFLFISDTLLPSLEANMANLYWRTNKIPREEAVQNLMAELPDYTDSRFFVKPTGDDGGSHLCVYIEREEDGSESCKDLPQSYGGWRIVHVFTPHEYIKYILLAERK